MKVLPVSILALLSLDFVACKSRSFQTQTRSSKVEKEINKEEAEEQLKNLSFDAYNSILMNGRVWNGELSEIDQIIKIPPNQQNIGKAKNSQTLLTIADRKAVPAVAFAEEKKTFKSDELVICDYVEPNPEKPFGGYSPKYNCKSPDHSKPFKVKYDETGKLVADPGGSITVPGIGGMKFSPSNPLDIFPNMEVYGEVAASQLMYMLGFEVDRNFPVQILCKNCPADPFTHSAVIASESKDSSLIKMRKKFITRNFVTLDFGSFLKSGERKNTSESDKLFEMWAADRKDRYFPISLIEIKNTGLNVEYKMTEAQKAALAPNAEVFTKGFSLRYYARNESINPDLDAKTRQLMRIEREAYAFILGGFLQHADSKSDNQRIVCPKDKVTTQGGTFGCSQAKLMAHDLGWTFGDGAHRTQVDSEIKMNFKGWNGVHIFMDRPTSGELKEPAPVESDCLVNVNAQFHDSALKNFYIHEESRRLAAAWLNALNDDELTNLFNASKIAKVGQRIVNGVESKNDEDKLNKLANGLKETLANLNKTLNSNVQTLAGDAISAIARASFVARHSTDEWKRVFIEKRWIINNTVCKHKMLLEPGSSMAWDGSNTPVPLDRLNDSL